MTVQVTGPSEKANEMMNTTSAMSVTVPRRALACARCAGLLEGETDGGEAKPHADEARDQERTAAEPVDECDCDESREHVDARRSPRWWLRFAPRGS